MQDNIVPNTSSTAIAWFMTTCATALRMHNSQIELPVEILAMGFLIPRHLSRPS